MERHLFLEQLQNDIVEKVGERGTAEVATGVGKTFIAFKWLYRFVPKGSKVSFFAETVVREATMKEEAFKFKRIFGKDVLIDYYVSFHCYQSVPDTDSIAHIYDEVHDMLTPVYCECFFKNQPKYCIGLSAYVPDTAFDRNDQFSESKRGVLHSFAPIKVTYTLEEGIADGVLSPFTTQIVEYELDNIKKTMVGGEQKINPI